MAQGYPQQNGGYLNPRFAQGQGPHGPQYPPPPHAQGVPFQPQIGEIPPGMLFPPDMVFPPGVPVPQVPMMQQPPLPMPYPEPMPQGAPPPGFPTVDLPPPPKDQPTAAKDRTSKKLFELDKDGSIVPSEKRGVSVTKPPEEPPEQSQAEPSMHPPAPSSFPPQAQSSIPPPVQQQAQPPFQQSVPSQAQAKAPPKRGVPMFDAQKIGQHQQQKKDAPTVRSLPPKEKVKKSEVPDTQQSKQELDYSKQAKEIGERTLGPNEGRQHKVYNTDFLDQMHDLIASMAKQPAASWRSPGESAKKMSALPERSSLGSAAKQKTPGRQALEFSREGMRSPPIDKSAVKRTQSAWVPKRERTDDAEPGIEKTVKVFRRLLNKVTPTTYVELSEEFCNKRIYEGGEDLLRAVVDLIFEKAVDEVKYCPTYADLCHKQSELERKEHSSNKFVEAIIAKCQRTFEHGLDEDPDQESKKPKLSEAEEDTEAEKARKKRKLVGTIELIAQLYMRSIVSCAVVAGCIAEVSTLYEKEKEEAYVEYAVKMLETVGKKFHKDPDVNERAGKSHTPAESWDMVYNYFLKMKHKMSSRVRFLVMNLEDLVRSKWDDEQRKAKGPRTLEQLEAEAREEERARVQQREAFDRKQRSARGGLVYSHSTLGPSVYGTRRGLPHQGRDSQTKRPVVVTRHGAPGFPPSTRPPSVSGTSYTGGSSRNPSPAASVHSVESQNRRQQEERDRRLKRAEMASRTAGGVSAAPQGSLRTIGRVETMGGRGRGGGATMYQQLRTNPWRPKEEGDGDSSKVEQNKQAPKTDEGGEASKVEQSKPAPKTDEGGGAPKMDGEGEASKVEQSKPAPKTDGGEDAP